MRYLAPATLGGQRLNLILGRTDNSTNPKEVKDKTLKNLTGINHLNTLQEIADKWVDRGCYISPGRVLRALVGGDL